MDGPPGFIGRKENIVYRLTKSLYRLEQSPRASLGRFSLQCRSMDLAKTTRTIHYF